MMEIFILIAIFQGLTLIILDYRMNKLQYHMEWLMFNVSEIYNKINSIIEKDDCR